ncbi:alanine acetyltransferase [Stenotrophomonas tumulicola]
MQAMGHTVFLDGPLAVELEAIAAAAAVAEVKAGPSPVAREPALPADAVPVAPRAAVTRQSPPAPDTTPAVATPPQRPRPGQVPKREEAAPAPGSRTGGARQPSVRLPDRLQIALLRASGCNPNDPATQALMDSWPLDALRGNAAAKRALWPQLRALRRKGQG